MRFWDSSALLPLLIQEPRTASVRLFFSGNRHLLWWNTPIECESAICRRLREGLMQPAEANEVRRELEDLRNAMMEVLPSQELRTIAIDLLQRYPLRAADAGQLAAAELWRQHTAESVDFVCLDQRLREAAEAHGFQVLPTTME